MYTVTRQLGGGTFGEVWLATAASSGDCVALKRCPVNEQDVRNSTSINVMCREYRFHCELKEHGSESGLYINQLSEAFITHVRTCAERQTLHLNMVFPLADLSLRDFFPTLHKSCEEQGSTMLISQLCADMLLGLHALHALGIAHRDVKPCNMLINRCGVRRGAPPRPVLCLCDLGAAKKLGGGGDGRDAPRQLSTPFIVSLPYRAPELLWGSICYGLAVDMWSAGCVAAEMFIASPLFYPTSEADMTFQVLSLLGAPTNADLRGMRLPSRALALLEDELGPFGALGLSSERLAGNLPQPRVLLPHASIPRALLTLPPTCPRVYAFLMHAPVSALSETAKCPLDIPAPAMQLIVALLRFAPEARPTCEQALRSCAFVRDAM